MRLARTIKIGGIKIGKQKVSQVYFREILLENQWEIDNIIKSGIRLEVVDADEAAIKDAIKKGKIPEINGYPVKLEPKLKAVIPTGVEIEARPVNVQVTTQATTAPGTPPPIKQLTAAEKKKLKAEEKKKKETKELDTPPLGA